MIERYIEEESIEFYSKYMSKTNPIGLPVNLGNNRHFISSHEVYIW